MEPRLYITSAHNRLGLLCDIQLDEGKMTKRKPSQGMADEQARVHTTSVDGRVDGHPSTRAVSTGRH